MACSWEIDAQGSYGLYLNMIIYRVDANEDTKYNHFAYYTNQDRKSKKIFEVREAQKSGLLLNTFDFWTWLFDLSLKDFDIGFDFEKRYDGLWNSTELYFSLESE